MTSDTPTLSVKNVSVHYGRHLALDNISLNARLGELIAVIGPNGAGKTTFIKALSGRQSCTGEIRIDGHILQKGADRRSSIGLVPQDIGLYGHMTGRENLSVMARMMGVPKSQRSEAVLDALQAVGMGEKAEWRVAHMSGGMKRRINVAAAIMHNPKVLIFDEPTAGVDIPARDVVHRLARKMARRGMVVLLITHELEQAEALCDRVLLLKDGKALACRAPSDILSEYFGDQRDIIVRYNTPPPPSIFDAMKPFGFKEAEHPTVFKTRTEAGEVSFVSAFMSAMRGSDQSVREITVRKPGLTSLLHDLETGRPS